MPVKIEKITPEQAAPVLRLTPNNIRYSMRNGTLPIGHVRRSNGRKYSRPTYRYDIYKHLVMQYVGITEWPEGV